MGTLKVDNIESRTGSTFTIGASGDTITIQSGATLETPGLTLSDNILFDTASKGIYLGVTSATASNLLDDYEEGTWTPSFTNVTGVSSATGSYVKVGNLVTVSVAINSSGTTVITLNSSIISNLPFTISAAGSGRYTGFFTDVTASAGEYGIHTLSGTSAIFTSSVSTGGIVAGSFTYRVA